MLIALFSMICFIFIPFFAQNLQTLLVGEVLQGIPWGVFQTMTTAYASEVAPVALRAYLTTYVNLCWVMGQFIAAGVLRSFLTKGGELHQRITDRLCKITNSLQENGPIVSPSRSNGSGLFLSSSDAYSLPSRHGGTSARAGSKKPRSPCFVSPLLVLTLTSRLTKLLL